MGALELIIYDKNSSTKPIDINTTRCFMGMKSRGPDSTSYNFAETPSLSGVNSTKMKKVLSKKQLAEYRQYQFIYGYHRLCINDLSANGKQPFVNPIEYKNKYKSRPKRMLICNGTVYNRKQLITHYEIDEEHDLESTTDCEVILPCWIKNIENGMTHEDALVDILNNLDGEYTFILTEKLEPLNLDTNRNNTTFELDKLKLFVVRDKMGMKPLYMIKHKTDYFYMFVTEIKCIPLKRILNDKNFEICEFPPGHYWSFNNPNEFIKYSDWEHPIEIVDANPSTLETVYNEIYTRVNNSIIKKYTNSEKKVGILLSGSFDSSIIASLVVEYLISNESDVELNLFTLGDIDLSEDVQKSIEIVEFLKTKYHNNIIHHVITIENPEHIVEDIKSIIYSIETFSKDVVRESLLFNYIFKYIKMNTDVQVLLVGDGLKELCGNHLDPECQLKTIRSLQKMRNINILKNDKIGGGCSLEIRYPFLDESIYSYILKLDPVLRKPMVYDNKGLEISKYIIRKAFDRVPELLPYNILWRNDNSICECFCDFQKILSDYVKQKYSNTDVTEYNNKHPYNTNNPRDVEELHYRLIYEKYFPYCGTIL